MFTDAFTALFDPYHFYSDSALAPEELKTRKGKTFQPLTEEFHAQLSKRSIQP